MTPASQNIVQKVKSLLASRDPAIVAAVKAANDGLLRCKLVSPGAVHNDATLTSMSVQYKNDEYIGTKLMPIVTVGKLSDKYYVYNKRDRHGVPDDAVDARSRPNEISESRSTATYSAKGYALMNFVDALTLANQDAPLNEMADLTASINDVLDLSEEIRIAAILTDTANFTGQTATLSGSDRWDSASGGSFIKNIQDAAASIWMGSGATKLVGYTSIEVMNVLSRHPQILDLFKVNTSGLATNAMIAGFLGLDEILVGKARKDTANEGATASYSRVWGKSFGMVRVATSPSLRSAAYGYTMRFGQKTATQWYDPAVGTRGGYYARVGLEEDHKIVAVDAGYLFATVIS